MRWHDKLVDYHWRSTPSDAELTVKLQELRRYFVGGLIAAGAASPPCSGR